jgi:hypothetical protein
LPFFLSLSESERRRDWFGGDGWIAGECEGWGVFFPAGGREETVLEAWRKWNMI